MSIIKSYNIFNEELRSSTYKLASDKLKKMGHVKRSKELEDYSKVVKGKEKEELVKLTYKDFSRFPSFKLSLVESINDEHPMIGNFFIKMCLSEDWLSDTISDWQGEKIKSGTPQWDLSAPFSVGIVPADDETKRAMEDEYFNDCRSDNGVYYTNEMYIYITSGCMIPGKVPNAHMGDDPTYGSKSKFYFANRTEAVKFKKMLLDGFEGHIKLWDDKFMTDGLPKRVYEFLSSEEDFWRNKCKWKDEYGDDRVGTDNPPVIADFMYKNAITSIKNMKINDLYLD
jgi:hypothetical protein